MACKPNAGAGCRLSPTGKKRPSLQRGLARKQPSRASKRPPRGRPSCRAANASVDDGDLAALATLVGVQRERAILDVALLVEADVAGHALVVGRLGQHGEV